MTDRPSKRVEFRRRLVADHYPARHAQAQSITTYDDFKDGVERPRIKYGDPTDRYPGGITYATAEERITCRIQDFRDHLADKHHYSQHSLMITYQVYGEGTPEQIEERIRVEVAKEEIRTDHRCPDCDVEVGEFHLPGCDVEVCPACKDQAISCGCAREEDNDDGDDSDGNGDGAGEETDDEDDDEDEDEDADEHDDPRSFRERLSSWLWTFRTCRWIAYQKRRLFPRKSTGPEVITIYAHEFGSDENGNGKSVGTAYRTMQRAMRDIPIIIEPGKTYNVDVTGLGTEVLPPHFSLRVEPDNT